MDHARTLETTKSSNSGAKERQSFVLSLWGVRYQVSDVAAPLISTLRSWGSIWIKKHSQLSLKSPAGT
jgi:hypothetical protein